MIRGVQNVSRFTTGSKNALTVLLFYFITQRREQWPGKVNKPSVNIYFLESVSEAHTGLHPP